MRKEDVLQSSKRVLIIDDCAMDNELLETALSECGIDSVVAMTSAGDAAKYVAGLPPHKTRKMPDLVFVDLFMAGIDGLGFIEWLRRDPAFAKLPLITLSGSANPQLRDEAIKLGATAYFRKPTSMEELKAIVEEVLHSVFHVEPKFWFETRGCPPLEPPLSL